jgi:hypothetical protein
VSDRLGEATPERVELLKEGEPVVFHWHAEEAVHAMVVDSYSEDRGTLIVESNSKTFQYDVHSRKLLLREGEPGEVDVESVLAPYWNPIGNDPLEEARDEHDNRVRSDRPSFDEYERYLVNIQREFEAKSWNFDTSSSEPGDLPTETDGLFYGQALSGTVWPALFDNIGITDDTTQTVLRGAHIRQVWADVGLSGTDPDIWDVYVVIKSEIE